MGNVTCIGERPFLRCNISYKEYGNAYYLGNSENPYLCLIEARSTDINSCEINENCKFIGSYAFSTCRKLASINIPNSITSIGSYAFYGCSGLTTVTIPNSVTSIGSYTFGNCSGLTSVTIPNSVTSIGNSAFSSCSGLTSVTIPNSVTSIGDRTFYGCSGLTSVTIPNSVTSIGNSAFQGCNSLTKTEFASIESLCRIYFADGSANPLSISKILHINGKEVTKVTIPNNVTSIGNYAFDNCSSLTTVTIPNSVTTIGNYAFYNCSSLTTVTIPNSVTTIGNYAFFNVKNIVYSGIASGTPWGALNVNGIIDGDFIYSDESKTNLTAYIGDGSEVEIPGSVTSIGSSAFYGCSGLTTVTIPNSVTSIGSSAFYGCSGLSTVTIPNSVTSIGSYAFYGCRGLTSVTIPNSVTSLSDDVFSHCSGLTTVSIPNSVTSIGWYAFAYCGSLISVIIPSSVKSIGSWAFRNDSGLASICYEGSSEPSYQSISFDNVDKTIPVYVPMNYASDSWCGFQVSKHNLITIPSTATCTESGLSEGRSCTCCNKVLIAQTSMPPLGHSYGTPTYKWAEDGRACTATVVCQRDANHIVTENATVTSEESIAPTCEEMGTTTYTAKFTDSKFSTQTKAVVDIAALGHNYGEPTYEWTEDGKSCTATAVCQRNENHVATENAIITSEENIAATCEEMGTTTYTATFENEPFTTQTKDVMDIAALGHDYGEPTYTWSSDGKSCIATAVCQRNENHVATENATITIEESIAPTCEGMGTTTYTATFGNELFATQTKDVVDIEALGHSYGEPTYEWAENGSACTATTICQRNETHVVTEDATITDEETVAPTCEEMGTTTYTATFGNELFATQTKDVVDVPANGHTPDSIVFENSVAATCTMVGTYDSVVYCTVCQAEQFREEKEVAALGHTYSSAVTAPTCTEVGYTTHVCSVCDYTYNSDTIAANGHTEVVDAAVVATCTTAGKTEGKHCSVCEAVLMKQEEVAALGHTEVVDAAVAATCTTAGKTEGKHCPVCNEVIVAQTVVAALGHSYGDYVYNNDATTDADGTETATCSRCGATDTHTAEGTKLPDATAVSESAATAVNIYAHHNIIVVENATEEIRVYDAMGRIICRNAKQRIRAEINVNAPGVYIVKTGNDVKRVVVN